MGEAYAQAHAQQGAGCHQQAGQPGHLVPGHKNAQRQHGETAGDGQLERVAAQQVITQLPHQNGNQHKPYPCLHKAPIGTTEEQAKPAGYRVVGLQWHFILSR